MEGTAVAIRGLPAGGCRAAEALLVTLCRHLT